VGGGLESKGGMEGMGGWDTPAANRPTSTGSIGRGERGLDPMGPRSKRSNRPVGSPQDEGGIVWGPGSPFPLTTVCCERVSLVTRHGYEERWEHRSNSAFSRNGSDGGGALERNQTRCYASSDAQEREKKSRKERGVDGKEPKPSVPRTRREHNTTWRA